MELRKDERGYELFDGTRTLMISWKTESERKLGELCATYGTTIAPRVLIGGLGMGFTLRAALDSLPPYATGVVAEIDYQVIKWNLGELAPLTRDAVRDDRVVVAHTDVANVCGHWDCILIDTDNGPTQLHRDDNGQLYADDCLLLRQQLRQGGLLGVWDRHQVLRYEYK